MGNQLTTNDDVSGFAGFESEPRSIRCDRRCQRERARMRRQNRRSVLDNEPDDQCCCDLDTENRAVRISPTISMLSTVGDRVTTIKEQRQFKLPFELDFIARPNESVIVNITMNSNVNRATIDFVNNNRNIPLHFDMRFWMSTVVRNSMTNGGWRSEERNGGFPFMRGGTFRIEFQILESMFRILVNDRSFITFNHRHPISSIRMLRIHGDNFFINYIETKKI